LRGEFAFVLWDDRKKTLFAARDRFGIKPLFYAETADGLYLASEAKALFAAGVPPGWDAETAFQNIFLCFDQTNTHFRNVKQIPPGCFLISHLDGGVSLRRYWDLDYPRRGQLRPRSEKACIAELKEHILESVRIRLRSDVQVGCYLSGGLDSSSVLGIATEFSPEKIAAFTVAFDHSDFDESTKAGIAAAHNAAPFTRVEVTEAACADCFADSVWSSEAVHYNAHGAARFLLSRQVRDAGYKTVLAGEGADELFAGYDFAQGALTASGNHQNPFQLLVRILKGAISPPGSTHRLLSECSPWLARMCRILAFSPPFVEALADKLGTMRGLLSADFLDEYRRRDPYAELIALLEPRANLRGRVPVHQLLYLWIRSLFLNYVLGAERLDMAHAVEVRLPFLDHKLFEFARELPLDLLLRGGARKYIFREAAKPFLPDAIYRADKQPFFAPPSTLRPGNRLLELLEDDLRSAEFSKVPFFNALAVRSWLDRMKTSESSIKAAMDPLLFMFASMGILQRRYCL
jgi:asparagine synthase (glutamine-hydrolysing)